MVIGFLGRTIAGHQKWMLVPGFDGQEERRWMERSGDSAGERERDVGAQTTRSLRTIAQRLVRLVGVGTEDANKDPAESEIQIFGGGFGCGPPGGFQLLWRVTGCVTTSHRALVLGTEASLQRLPFWHLGIGSPQDEMF